MSFATTSKWKNIAFATAAIFLGICVAVVCTEISLQVASPLYQYWNGKNKIKSLYTKDEIRILCIGESTTAVGGDHSYPSTLERALKKEYPHKKISVINEGLPGTSTWHIAQAIQNKLNL